MFWSGLGLHRTNAHVHMCDKRRLESRSRTFGRKVPAFLRHRLSVVPRPPGLAPPWQVGGSRAPRWAAPRCSFPLAAVPGREGREYFACQYFWLCLHLVPSVCAPRTPVLPSCHLERTQGLAGWQTSEGPTRSLGKFITAFGASVPCRVTLSHATFLPTVLLSEIHFGDTGILLFKYLYAAVSRMHSQQRFGPGKCKLFALFIEQ